MRYVTNALVPFFQKCKHWCGQKTKRATGPSIFLAFWQPCKPKRKSRESTEARIQRDDIGGLMDGCLYMNAAGYYHGPPGEQVDPLEAPLVCGMGIYTNWILSIYRMFTVRENDIVNNTVLTTWRMNDGSRCARAESSLCGMIALNKKPTSEQILSLHRHANSKPLSSPLDRA